MWLLIFVDKDTDLVWLMQDFHSKLTWEKWVTPWWLQLTQLSTVARTSYPLALHSCIFPHASMVLVWPRSELDQGTNPAENHGSEFLKIPNLNFLPAWVSLTEDLPSSTWSPAVADSTYFGKTGACNCRTNCLHNTFLASGQCEVWGLRTADILYTGDKLPKFSTSRYVLLWVRWCFDSGVGSCWFVFWWVSVTEE